MRRRLVDSSRVRHLGLDQAPAGGGDRLKRKAAIERGSVAAHLQPPAETQTTAVRTADLARPLTAAQNPDATVERQRR